MRKVLQITFCILACLCAAAAIPIFAVFGLFGLIPLGGVLLFAGLMLLAKYGLPRREKKQPKTDFMNSDEENERIRREQDEGDPPPAR